MTQKVCTGAMLKCSFGVAPTVLNILPDKRVLSGTPAGNIMDKNPPNIMTFGMCMTPSNPAVAAAISASLGAVTQAPCVPVIPAPWIPGAPTVLAGNMPTLNQNAKCICMWGGIINITMPGQVTVNNA